MVLDSSAIVALLLAEPGYERLLDLIDAAEALGVGAPTLVETAIVLSSRLGRDARPLLGEWIRASEIDVVPFTSDHFHAAIDAYLRFGKGRHKAGLNFGDCLAYAVAQVAEAPLLYTGQDFSWTDVRTA